MFRQAQHDRLGGTPTPETKTYSKRTYKRNVLIRSERSQGERRDKRRARRLYENAWHCVAQAATQTKWHNKGMIPIYASAACLPPRAMDSFVEKALYSSGGRNTGADRKDGAILFVVLDTLIRKLTIRTADFCLEFCFDKKKIRNGCGFLCRVIGFKIRFLEKSLSIQSKGRCRRSLSFPLCLRQRCMQARLASRVLSLI